MARKKRVFVDCGDMKDVGTKLLKKYQGVLFGIIDPNSIRFARITSEQAKNSSDMCSEENGKDWLEKAQHQYLVASYSEAWDTWSNARKQLEVLIALMNLPINMDEKKIKPDVVGHSFILEKVGLRWREKNNSGEDLPELLGEEFEISDVQDNEETEFPD